MDAIKYIDGLEVDENGDKTVQISFIESFFDMLPTELKAIAEKNGYRVWIDEIVNDSMIFYK